MFTILRKWLISLCAKFSYALWGSGMFSKYDVISLSSRLSYKCSLYHVYKGLGIILCFALDPGLYCISCLQIEGGGYDWERDFSIFEFPPSLFCIMLTKGQEVKCDAFVCLSKGVWIQNFLKHIECCNFQTITVMYIKVYISGMEMSQRIHFWY